MTTQASEARKRLLSRRHVQPDALPTVLEKRSAVMGR